MVALIAIGGAAFFLIRSEKQLAILRADGRAFDLRAREVTDTLADLRSAQQAYVAAGQGVAFWMPKVGQTSEDVGKAIAILRASATSTAARSAIDEATATLAQFADVDRRARDYLRAGLQLMAGDVIFTEGDQTAASAARQVETARLAEHQALDASEAGVRKQEGLALAAAGGLTAIIVLLLAVRRTPDSESTDLPASIATDPSPPSAEDRASSNRVELTLLKGVAQLCTDFGCVRDINDLQILLARAGDIMDAAGLVVWLGSTTGADLRPVLTHGYTAEVRARLPSVPRSADNAAAAAYRSRELQLVLSRPGGLTGAIVAPIMSPDGCIGALSAEIRGGGEASDSVQALAAIVAAHLAGVLATNQPESSEARLAASS